MPLRFFEYKQKAFHYFLFDLCYYVTILNIVFIWLFPSSPTLFVACYCLSHGSLASAVITWRNSLVFHDVDKVTSLFIHIYAPFTFTTIRHYLPNSVAKFPALAEVPHLNPLHALLFSSVIYCIWQGLYWQFVYIGKKAKVDSGQRVTSFSYLLADKRGAIGKALSSVPEDTRVFSFMLGQFSMSPLCFSYALLISRTVYSITTEIPAVYFLYDSARNSTIFLLVLFGISVWNGGGFYIEVRFIRHHQAIISKYFARYSDVNSKRSSRLSARRWRNCRQAERLHQPHRLLHLITIMTTRLQTNQSTQVELRLPSQ